MFTDLYTPIMSGIHQSVISADSQRPTMSKTSPILLMEKIAPIFHGDDWGIVYEIV